MYVSNDAMILGSKLTHNWKLLFYVENMEDKSNMADGEPSLHNSLQRWKI